MTFVRQACAEERSRRHENNHTAMEDQDGTGGMKGYRKRSSNRSMDRCASNKV